jgi:hypothetical protein
VACLARAQGQLLLAGLAQRVAARQVCRLQEAEPRGCRLQEAARRVFRLQGPEQQAFQLPEAEQQVALLPELGPLRAAPPLLEMKAPDRPPHSTGS